MSLIHGIVLGSFLLFSVNFFIACVILFQRRHAKLAAEKGLSRGMRVSGTLGAALFFQFALVWSGFTLLFDYIMYIRDAAKQFGTVSYVAADGEVTKCREVVKQDNEVSTRELDVEYKYSVDGQDFRGAVIRNLKIGTEGSRSEFIGTHPVGTSVAVYYDPAAPMDAVLLPGVGGTELVVPLVLMPFNVVMFAFWGAGIVYGIHGQDGLFRTYHGLQFTEGEVARVRLSHFTPIAGAVITLGTLPIPAYVCVVAFTPQPTTCTAAIVAWIVVLGGTVCVHYYLSHRAASSRFDLVIDRLQRTLTLPATYGRAQPIQVPFANLLAVEIVTKTDDEKCVWYSTIITWRSGGEPQESKIAEWSDQGQAKELAAWVRRKVELAR